jgi:hypothetical protein
VQCRRAAAQVRADGDHHRQRADDHRRQRPAGALDRRGEAQVVQQVADRRELQGLDPVAARELRQPRPIEPGERQRDQAEGQIARHREQRSGVLRQQQRHDEDEAPHEAGGEGVGGAGEHGRRSLSDGLEARPRMKKAAPDGVRRGLDVVSVDLACPQRTLPAFHALSSVS